MEDIQSISKDIEKGEDKKGAEKDDKKGLSQSSKENIFVYVAILLVIILAATLTAIKIVSIDIHSDKYSHLFDSNGEHRTNQTSSELPMSAAPEWVANGKDNVIVTHKNSRRS